MYPETVADVFVMWNELMLLFRGLEFVVADFGSETNCSSAFMGKQLWNKTNQRRVPMRHVLSRYELQLISQLQWHFPPKGSPFGPACSFPYGIHHI
jgi:hypothetical protein